MIPEIEQPRPQGPTSPPPSLRRIPPSSERGQVEVADPPRRDPPRPGASGNCDPQSTPPLSPQSSVLSTDRRLRANRANAQKSTGPTSPEGKARSSRNALKHGLLARQVVLTHHGTEDPAEFDELLTEIREAYQPSGPCQHALVHRIAAYSWRLARAQRFEVRAISTALDHGRAAAQNQIAADLAEYDRQISAARADVGEARAYLRCLTDDPDIDPLDERLTFNLEPAVTEIARQYGRLLPEFVIAGNCVDDYGQFLFELGLKTREQVRAAFIAALQCLLQRCEELLAELESKRTSPCDNQSRDRQGADPCDMDAVDGLGLLPGPDRLKLLIRYETMLCRERDRAVAELSRLQAQHADRGSSASPGSPPHPGADQPIVAECDQPTDPHEAHPSREQVQTTINPGLPTDAHRSLRPAAKFLAPARANRLTDPPVRTQARRRRRSPQSATPARSNPYDRETFRRAVREVYGTNFFPANPEEIRESEAPFSPPEPISAPPHPGPSARASRSALKTKAGQWRRPAPSLPPRTASSKAKHRFAPTAICPPKGNFSKRTHLWGPPWPARYCGQGIVKKVVTQQIELNSVTRN